MFKLQMTSRFLIILTALISMLFSSIGYAAKIISCEYTRKLCTIRLEEGVVGNKVVIKDDKTANIVGYGKIVRKLSGPFAKIKVKLRRKGKTLADIKRGFIVVVENDNAKFGQEQAASFSYDEKFDKE